MKKAGDAKIKIIEKAKKFSNDMVDQTEKVYSDIRSFKEGKYSGTAEKIESEIKPETRVESKPEAKEETLFQAAELLENPPDGSFQQGLQAFIAWVKALLAKGDWLLL